MCMKGFRSTEQDFEARCFRDLGLHGLSVHGVWFLQ